MNGFEATARKEAGAAVIDMKGEINRSSEQALNAAYSQAVDGSSGVVLNFEGVDYINSTGIAVIVGLLARARKEEKRLIACGLSEHYREIFQITRLVDFMTIYEDEASAVADAPA